MTTVTIPQGQVLTGAFVNNSALPLEIDGPGKFDPSLFINDVSTTTINADTIGHGTFYSNNLTFGGSVGHGVLVEVSPFAGRLTINDPAAFKGTVGAASPLAPFNGPTGVEIDLVGLANADSASFKRDILTITGHGKTVDTLRLAPTLSTTAFTVAEVGGNVYVLTGEFSGVASGGTVLYQHP